MRPFAYQRAADAADAVTLAAGPTGPPTAAVAQFLAGGTTLVDLMRTGAMAPERLVDINDLAAAHGRIEAGADGLRLGALVRMSQASRHPAVLRDYPAIAQSLDLAASQQLRNMASLGGNVLQRTRCRYFRDPSWPACNKRAPGSGCGALDGVNRMHAVLGVSEACIASYPGDFAQALIALDASVEIVGPQGPRVIAFEDLHRAPGATPHIETTLAPGELITGFHVPSGRWTRRSLYLKVRDRQSYEFALASAAVALEFDGGAVRTARIALGGVATRPWRAREAEAALVGKPLEMGAAQAAAEVAFAGAVTHGQNDFKPELGRRTLVRALLAAGRLEV
ncbi:MAG TPA: xanthine dehydrogenase family protein subunit M [Caulobacteraceae bacterium]|jgi:xanthine dehydrogenase YagS FAD-binding subunit